ncbi:MAG TPA: hypothetical protein VGA24_02735 [Steroidobacteraceae bacterium]
MEQDQEPPFPREPWQRLLQDRADVPPETTDARIRAAARKAVAPRAARWWLPASLAASFLLAVLIVQWQYGNDEVPAVVTEADLAPPAVDEAPPAARMDSAPAQRKESPPRIAPFERAPVEVAPEPEARLGGPEQDLKAASEMVAEETDETDETGETDEPDLGASLAESGFDSREAPRPAAAAQAGALAKVRTPEAWYAAIAALRKAGRIEEADAELARFEAAYPDWLKEQGLSKP